MSLKKNPDSLVVWVFWQCVTMAYLDYPEYGLYLVFPMVCCVIYTEPARLASAAKFTSTLMSGGVLFRFLIEM